MHAALNEHTVAPPALTADYEKSGLELALTPAERGNLYARQARYGDALRSYREAVAREPQFAQAHLACAELAHLLRDEALSREHLHAALAIRRVYLDPLPIGGRTPVVLLLRDAPYNVNAPLEMVLDRSRVAVHKAYVEGDVELPDGMRICAIGYARDAEAALDRVAELAPGCLNAPDSVRACARERLAATLAGVDGVVTVPTKVVPAEELARIEVPSLVRPVDTHAGEGLLYARGPSDVQAHHQRWHANAYHVSHYHEYRSPDGFYRKYRFVIVDGVAYPYHQATSERWMVHYRTSATSQNPWMREEEQRFLADPASVFPAFDRTAAELGARTGLDYVGFDVAALPDGRMLVFEADPAMLIHDEDDRSDFAYKRPAVARIREALHTLLGKQAPR